MKQYRHYKGGLYEVIDSGVTHTESGEILVVYRSLEDGKVWARPLSIFFGEAIVDGKRVPRFEEHIASSLQENTGV